MQSFVCNSCRVDPDSELYKDMKKLKEVDNMDHILLHFLFEVRMFVVCSLKYVRMCCACYILDLTVHTTSTSVHDSAALWLNVVHG